MTGIQQAHRRYYADPALIAARGRFYLYPTTDGHADWASDRFEVLVSDDLEQWEPLGPVLTLGTDVRWASAHAWAPAVHERDGRFHLYFTADDHIGVAVADAPEGPFVDSGDPVVAAGAFAGRAIDPSVFEDDDGTTYLVWGNGVAHIARLRPDLLAIEPGSAQEWRDPTFREAAHLHRRGDRYYWTWSENDTRDPEYRVRWASGPSPIGPWTSGGVLLEQDASAGAFATGHHSILRIPGTDDWRIAYHRFAVPDGDGFHREIVIDRLRYADDGALIPVTPSVDAITVASDSVPTPLST